jgi:hypothetical protein
MYWKATGQEPTVIFDIFFSITIDTTYKSRPGGTCLGECPAGQVQITVDPAGDGKTCVIGCKAFCCDPPA